MMQKYRRSVLPILAIATCCALIGQALVAAEADPAIPVLTPKDVIGWMAPLRVENGRLGVDWSAIGLIAARHAGVKPDGERWVSAIDTDVKFVVNASQSGDANAPEVQIVLHADGGSSTAKASDEKSRDLPISVHIVQKSDAGGLRGELSTHGRPSKDGQSYDASEMKLNLDSPTCLALYAMNGKTREYRMKFKEERILKLDLSITLTGNMLLIRFENTDIGTGFDFTQQPNGEVALSYSQGEAKKLARAADFHDLIQKFTPELQLNFFRPLSDVGVQIALCPDLPVVMAAAATGFSDPLPANAKKADALIKAIADAALPAERAKAVTDLARYYPQAIQRIAQAAEKAQDPNLKAALQKAIAAHPGIARALPYVKTHLLHEDRDYLFDIFEHVTLLKDAARARLAILDGKDLGDNPEDWKKK